MIVVAFNRCEWNILKSLALLQMTEAINIECTILSQHQKFQAELISLITTERNREYLSVFFLCNDVLMNLKSLLKDYTNGNFVSFLLLLNWRMQTKTKKYKLGEIGVQRGIPLEVYLWPRWIVIFHYLLNASVDMKNGWSDYLFFLVAVTILVRFADVYIVYSLNSHTHTHAHAHSLIQPYRLTSQDTTHL